MVKLEYQTDINAPRKKVYEYYTNPDNIKRDVASRYCKKSQNVSGQKREEGSEIKVKGEFMGKEEEMRLEVIDKEQNKRLVTRQIEGPFKRWESIQEFQDSNNGNSISATHIRHTIDYELPAAGKIAYLLSGSQADNKIREGLQQAAQIVKQKLETSNGLD
jgi:ligand-binding SRPBCC domain-containing protein